MEKYLAKLTGATDGYSISREFLSKASAIAWVQGDGLAEFDDQLAPARFSTRMVASSGENRICRLLKVGTGNGRAMRPATVWSSDH
jgi:hypothetical protein